MASRGGTGLSPKQKAKIKRFTGWQIEQYGKMGQLSRKRNSTRSVLKDREGNNTQRLNTNKAASTNDSADMG